MFFPTLDSFRMVQNTIFTHFGAHFLMEYITQVAKRGEVPVFAIFSDFFFSKKSISERLRGRRMPKIYFWKL